MNSHISPFVSHMTIATTLAVAGFFIYPYFTELGVPVSGAERAALLTDRAIQGKISAEEQKLLPAFLIDVPFTSQAPFEKWDQPWQDACEEASVLMAVAWARKASLTPALAAEEILKQVEFEERVFGYHKDTNIQDTARLFTEFYRYGHIEVRDYGITIDAIKQEIASGNLVVVPFAGALLENPYFTTPPHYHMAVIRGYDDERQEFIVNEPGTKRGEAFRYTYENLMESIHDWTGSAATIHEGKRAMIVVRPLLQHRRARVSLP